ncbi:MAG: hypothetical protein KAI67_02645 [Candidatus Pacebacteria bacterium]|nr:hypothetical protein [Candidatus Paceibacterota bacterium]
MSTGRPHLVLEEKDVQVQVFETLFTAGFDNKLVQLSTLRIERGDYIYGRTSRDGYLIAEVQKGMNSVFIVISIDIFAEIKTIKKGDWITLKDGRIAEVISMSVTIRGDTFENTIIVRPLVQEPNLMDVYDGENEPVGIDDIESLFIQMGRFPLRK